MLMLSQIFLNYTRGGGPRCSFWWFFLGQFICCTCWSVLSWRLWGRVPLQIPRTVSVQLFPLPHSYLVSAHLLGLPSLPSLRPQCRGWQPLPGFPLPELPESCGSSWARLVFPHLSGVAVLCCLLSIAWKLLFHRFCSVFEAFEVGEDIQYLVYHFFSDIEVLPTIYYEIFVYFLKCIYFVNWSQKKANLSSEKKGSSVLLPSLLLTLSCLSCRVVL